MRKRPTEVFFGKSMQELYTDIQDRSANWQAQQGRHKSANSPSPTLEGLLDTHSCW